MDETCYLWPFLWLRKKFSIIEIFWPIELNALWYINICRFKVILWSGTTFILLDDLVYIFSMLYFLWLWEKFHMPQLRWRREAHVQEMDIRSRVSSDIIFIFIKKRDRNNFFRTRLRVGSASLFHFAYLLPTYWWHAVITQSVFNVSDHFLYVFLWRWWIFCLILGTGWLAQMAEKKQFFEIVQSFHSAQVAKKIYSSNWTFQLGKPTRTESAVFLCSKEGVGGVKSMFKKINAKDLSEQKLSWQLCQGNGSLILKAHR